MFLQKLEKKKRCLQIKKDVLECSLKEDVLGRVKCQEYSLELPNFYKKRTTDWSIIDKTLLNPSPQNVAILERALEHLKLFKEDYGLTRFEALGLLAGQALLRLIGKKHKKIIRDPHILEMTDSFLKFSKKKGFDDFLMRN